MQIKSFNAEARQTDQSSFLTPHKHFVEHLISEKKNTMRAQQELEKISLLSGIENTTGRAQATRFNTLLAQPKMKQ
jgi:hypothetical protein